jgi:hypothetical protein
MHTKFQFENLKEEESFGRPRHGWKINKTDRKKLQYEDKNRTNMAKDRDQWQSPVNTTMSLWVSKKLGSFLTS